MKKQLNHIFLLAFLSLAQLPHYALAESEIPANEQAVNEATMSESASSASTDLVATRGSGPLMAISLEDFPLQLDNWKVSVKGDAASPICMLTSTPEVIEDGHGGTTVSLQIAKGEITLLTGANIDSSYADTGLSVDSHEQHSIETIKDKTNLIYKKGFRSLIQQMRKGESLEVSLGFWPTWPITRSYQTEIDLERFKEAFLNLSRCSKFIND